MVATYSAPGWLWDMILPLHSPMENVVPVLYTGYYSMSKAIIKRSTVEVVFVGNIEIRFSLWTPLLKTK